MTRQTAFADTEFEGFRSMEPVAQRRATACRPSAMATTSALAAVLARRQAFATAMSLPTPRAAATPLSPPVARRPAQPAAGTTLLVSLITLVLMPTACLSMLFVLQTVRF